MTIRGFSSRRAVTVLLLSVGALGGACSGSRDKLLADLQSPRPEERALAVKKLAKQGKAEDLILFTQAAKDPAAIVRGEAVSALGASQDERVVDLLGELLGDPDEDVQGQAAMSLAQIKSDKAKAYLTLQYARRGRNTRWVIVQALKAANVPGAMAGVVAAEGKGLWERNLAALNEGTLAERVAAAENLGKSGRAEAVARLMPMINDSQVVLAAAAVRGLGYAGDRRAAAPIAGVLSENFPELREAACESLLRLQDPAALGKLAEVALERSSASPLATTAIIALPRSPETDKTLCDIAVAAAPGEAGAAGRELRQRSGCPLEPLLERLKQPAQVPGALQALRALGPTAKEAAARVIPLLTSTDASIRRQAVDALAELGDLSAGPAVMKAYDAERKTLASLQSDWIPAALPRGAKVANPRVDDDRKGETAALLSRVDGLRESQAARAGKTLLVSIPPREVVDDVGDERLEMLSATLRAIGSLRAEGALKVLSEFAADPNPNVRASALSGAASLGKDGIAVAKVGLTDAERSVQSAVASALAEQGFLGEAAILEVLPRLPGDKGRLLEAITRAGLSKAAVGPLQQVVKEQGADAETAARMLGTLKATEAVDGMLKYLEDPTAVARRDVLLALGKIGDRRVAETLARDLYNDSAEVRAAAAEALASVGTPAQIEALDALKGDYYRRVRDHAEVASKRLGSASPEGK